MPAFFIIIVIISLLSEKKSSEIKSKKGSHPIWRTSLYIVLARKLGVFLQTLSMLDVYELLRGTKRAFEKNQNSPPNAGQFTLNLHF